MRAISSGVFWSVLILLFTSSLHQQLRLFMVSAEDMVPLVELGKEEVQAEATVCHLHAAMQSIATFQTGHLDSVLSLPRLVIALDAISNS
ncbi:hypothetical protein SASPL_136982 [Salvia splendens]|uniref:Uncharacterized protein n=1 Tax=Salvia splendens TaxID=180675 RepID=A0A8X8ZI29_SALSN|nr:hypothetical protein SASPL_136982 [Salvia splendens]